MLVRYVITQASVWKRPLQPHRKSHRSPKKVKVTLSNVFFIIIYFHSEGCSLDIEAHRPAVERRLKLSGRTHPTRGEHHLMLTVFNKCVRSPSIALNYIIISSLGDHPLMLTMFTKCVSSALA